MPVTIRAGPRSIGGRCQRRAVARRRGRSRRVSIAGTFVRCRPSQVFCPVAPARSSAFGPPCTLQGPLHRARMNREAEGTPRPGAQARPHNRAGPLAVGSGDRYRARHGSLPLPGEQPEYPLAKQAADVPNPGRSPQAAHQDRLGAAPHLGRLLHGDPRLPGGRRRPGAVQPGLGGLRPGAQHSTPHSRPGPCKGSGQRS